MIIPDTSIWIEFFKKHEPYFSQLRDHLERQEILVISSVFGELLQGVKNNKEKEIILDYWKYLPKIDETELLVKAGEYSYQNKFISKGVGIIDASIIVIAIDNNAVILTLDQKLKRVVKRESLYSQVG